MAALETLRGTQEVLQAALSVELEQLPAGEEEEALGEVLKGGREALEAMDLEELRVGWNDYKYVMDIHI